MHDFVCFNGEVLSVLNAQIPAVSAAALYGAGVFTTVAIYNRKLFLWHLHAERLRDNAAKVNLNLTAVDFESVKSDLLELIAANKIERGRARVTLFDASASDVWQFQINRKTEVLIIANHAPEKPKNNLRLTISPFPVNSASPLASVKSCNYLENLIALKNAKASGFDEAVRLNERGEIVSAAMANVFWTKGETIFTPAVKTGALDGTTRRFVIKLAADLGFEVVEAFAPYMEIDLADNVFLTSAGLGVCAVKSLNDKVFASDSLTSKLQIKLLESATF